MTPDPVAVALARRAADLVTVELDVARGRTSRAEADELRDSLLAGEGDPVSLLSAVATLSAASVVMAAHALRLPPEDVLALVREELTGRW